MAVPRVAAALDQPIRNRRRTSFFSACGWLFAVCLIGCAILLVVRFGTKEALPTIAGAAGFCVLPAAIAIWIAMRVRRAEVRIGSGSVIVRNLIRCHTVRLDEVDEFQPGNVTPGGNNGTPGIVMHLKDGGVIPIWALAEESSIFSAKRKALAFAPLVSELNTLLAAAREQPVRR
jgi:hypothetical protein